MSHTYNLNQCALFKVTTKRKLAEILYISTEQLKHLTEKKDNNFNVFIITPNGRKPRTIEQPNKTLEKIHVRLFKLLQRITPPNYLYSGVKGRSYVDNALAHLGNHNVATLDIKKFYPSTTKHHVFSFYKDILQCSPDVSGILMRLTIYDGHVPTGSPLSQQLAFYSHYKMFNQINKLSQSYGIKMTCYVDDLTFSGRSLSKRFIYEVKKIIHQRGLAYHKECFYTKDVPKSITGVIIKGDKAYVPNKLHKGIGLGVRDLNTLTTDELRSLVGKCNAASQIDKKFFSYAKRSRRVLNKRIK